MKTRPHPSEALRLFSSSRIAILLRFWAFLGANHSAFAYQKEIIVADEPMLSEIAVKYYGKASYWQRIAEWNHLAEPYFLKPGQKLTLRKEPRLSNHAGKTKLLNMWRDRISKRDGASNKTEDEISQASVEPTLPNPADQKRYDEARAAITAAREEEFQLNEIPSSEDVAKSHFELAQFALKSGDLETALREFKSSREISPEEHPPWILELKLLRTLNRMEEFREVGALFIDQHPQIKNLPLLDGAFSSGKSESP